MRNDMHETVHQNSEAKEKMLESFEPTASLETHESRPSLEVEPDEGDKRVEWETYANKNEVPKLGQVFESEDEAFQFYIAYGLKEGFRVRKNKLDRKRDGTIYMRQFSCCKEGHRKNDRRSIYVKKRREATRTGCMACLVIKLNDDDKWVVKEFITDHNHPREAPSVNYLLKAQRRLKHSHDAGIIDCEDIEAHEPDPSLEVQPNSGDNANKNTVPELGQVFTSDEVAFQFYSAYGRKEGFFVRKNKLERRSNGKIYRREFACCKEGHRKKDHRSVNVKKRRAPTRTGCMACLVIRLNDDGTWVVKKFIADHNHPKATPSKMHLLREKRKLQPRDVAKIIGLEDVWVPPADGIGQMAKKARGRESIGIMKLDHQNFLHAVKTTKKNEVGKGEAQGVMDYFKRMQLENPSFFYAVRVNSNHEMFNFFWADARSIMDYGHFSDVICFDTTYRTKEHSWPFASFIGINHHRQTILFGAALLSEETTDSFVWLFKTFLQAMCGRKPNTLLTEQCDAMAKAINIVMPDTHHRLCLRQIFQNAAIYLPYVYKDPNFSTDFKKCVYNDETEEAFSLAWNQMLQKYGLLKNKWLKGLFEVRNKWALVYGRNTFCADMTTTQRSESINFMLQKFLERKLSLPEVLLCYEKVLASRRAKELKAEFDSSRASPVLYINTPMLQQVAKVYTPEVCEMFQKEFKKFLFYNVENGGVDGTVQKYKVTKIEGCEECLVTLDASTMEVICSCKKFEFIGIQCKHVIKVLNYNNIHVLPSHYLLKRWTKDARVRDVKNSVQNPIQVKPNTNAALRYANISRMAVNLATRGSVSDEAHSVAISSLEKALEDVEAILKETQTTASYNNVHRMNDCESPIDVTLTLAQGNEKVTPSNARMKRCMVRQRMRERAIKRINIHGDSGSNTVQPMQKKRREGESVSIDGRNNGPLVNPSCPEEVSTQVSQVVDPIGVCLSRSSQSLDSIGASEKNLPCNIPTPETNNTLAVQKPYHASGLQPSSSLPSLGVIRSSLPLPLSGLPISSLSGVPIPSINAVGETSTIHVEPIRPPNSLRGDLPPPSIG